MKYCLDVLGAASYPKVVLQNVPVHIGLGVFGKEFKDAYPFVKKAISHGFSQFKIQMLWGGKSHAYGDKDIPAIQKMAAQYNGLAHSGITIFLSPFCEHTLSNPDKYLDIVQTAAPLCIPLNTPLLKGIKKGALSKKYQDEVHGTGAKPLDDTFSYSDDGNDCIDTDIGSNQKVMIDADEYYYWRPRFNLHADEHDPSRNSPPDATYMKQVVALCQNKGVTKLPPHHTWKPVSEKNKPVYICPIRTDKIVLKRGSARITTLDYYGLYEDGRHRYYTGAQGYQIGKVDVWIDGKKVGNINAPFRDGDFHK